MEEEKDMTKTKQSYERFAFHRFYFWAFKGFQKGKVSQEIAKM